MPSVVRHFYNKLGTFRNFKLLKVTMTCDMTIPFTILTPNVMSMV